MSAASRSRMATVAAALAAGMFVLALAGFGAAQDGYSQVLHPPGLLGARGIAHAVAFNLVGFVLPGLLAAVAVLGLRRQLDGAGWTARIGAWCWLLSALAFAAQGGLPLDPADPDSQASGWHATAWTVWWLAFVPGGLLLAAGLAGRGGAGRWRALQAAAGIAAVLLPLFALSEPLGLPAGVSQRAALAIWFACVLVAGSAAARRPQP